MRKKAQRKAKFMARLSKVRQTIKEYDFSTTLAELDRQLETATLGVINSTLKLNTQVALSEARRLYGDDSDEVRLVEAFEKRAYRKRKELEKYAGTVIASHEVTSAEILTPESMEMLTTQLTKQLPLFSIEGFGNLSKLEGDPVELSKETREVFAKPESQYIIDSLYSLMTDHARNRITDKEATIIEKEDEYIIQVSPDVICRRAGLSGAANEKMRARVKDTIIPEYDEKSGKWMIGGLSYIFIRRGREGLRMRFLSVDNIKTKDSVPLLRLKSTDIKSEIVGTIDIHINRAAYSCLDALHNIVNGNPVTKEGIGGGYRRLVKNLSMKIDTIIAGLVSKAKAFPDENRNLETLARSPLRFRLPVVFAIDKWESMEKPRKGALTITSEELIESGRLPKHTKDKSRRDRDLFALCYICEMLRKEGEEAFPGCSRIELVLDKGIVFHV